MTSVKLRGLESNQRPPGSEPGVATSSNRPAVFLPYLIHNSEKGSGRRIRTSIACFKVRQPAISRSPIIKAEGEGVEPPRLIAQPFSRRLPSPVGLLFRKAPPVRF